MRNWAGTYEFTAARIVEAASEDDVRRIVASVPGRVHALGTRHSFTDLADTSDTLIDLVPLSGEFSLDREAGTVTVSAGTRYGVLALWLEEQGFALHNLGSLPHISVAGATATGTHGSGVTNGVLTTAVRALRYVDAVGEVHEVRADDADFAALAVGLGAFGIVVAVTLAVEPTYRVRQDVYRGMSWAAALADFDQVLGAGYSVSVFSHWDEEAIGDIWVKTRLDADDDEVADALLDSVRDSAAQPLGDTADVTELGGVPGPWLLRLPHFRLDGTPSWGDEIQTEYFVDRADAAAALLAVRALAPMIQPHLLVTELRTAASDSLWLSPAYERDVLAIHFTWKNEPEGVHAVIPHIERALEPFLARPHWGKVHAFDRAGIERVHPRLADARAVFERLDPQGRFVNDHLIRVGVRDAR